MVKIELGIIRSRVPKQELNYLLKGYAEAGALDGEHRSFYRRCCQLIKVKDKRLPSVGREGLLSLAIDYDRP